MGLKDKCVFNHKNHILDMIRFGNPTHVLDDMKVVPCKKATDCIEPYKYILPFLQIKYTIKGGKTPGYGDLPFDPNLKNSVNLNCNDFIRLVTTHDVYYYNTNIVDDMWRYICYSIRFFEYIITK